ncbi:MAG: thioredoxin family protein, partial [Planctomycetota bacterium]|nr:thioredoxin family protein [Planctomycetota bacterium]
MEPDTRANDEFLIVRSRDSFFRRGAGRNLFEGMLKAIRRASTGDDELPAEFVKDLGRVASDVYLRVFVSPTCPACKPVIDAALRMALTSSKVRADIIDATAFLDLADRFDVYGVPTTILNDRFSLGPVPEE